MVPTITQSVQAVHGEISHICRSGRNTDKGDTDDSIGLCTLVLPRKPRFLSDLSENIIC